ncbi:LysR family transcriptional regulator [uncultured Streptomyces sp.]|uniref:LysR family transcriptional regulator n=1 Tax=uncultured Streptomyces sp. TaxID=174707 RepID=UPI00260A1E8F|nr:LysR family transcriptional regulator [uncultured Streptomyces sp.]
MVQRDIEVKLLRTLVAIVDECGFARAAQALHVTQPTVSQQMQRLESIVQAPVFQRDKRPLQLTPVGRELVAHARRVLMLNGEVLSKLSAIQSDQSFSMGCSVHLADGLRNMLGRLAAERPHLRCAMTTGLSSALADRLALGELEAALLLGTRTPRSEVLGRLRLAWFGDAPLASGKSFPMAFVSERSALSVRIIDTLAEHGVAWHSVPWCSDPLSIRASVQAGLAYTALPADTHHNHPSLHPTPAQVLGPPPEPLLVHLGFSATAGETVREAARAVARATLSDLPLVPL